MIYSREINRQLMGLGAEYRVMSELMLRGESPAKPAYDTGVDIYLESGKKIQVKSARVKSNKRHGSNYYEFWLTHGTKNKWDLSYTTKCLNWNKVDFVICWCVDDDVFYIMDKSIGNVKTVAFYPVGRGNSKYEIYRERWELILPQN